MVRSKNKNLPEYDPYYGPPFGPGFGRGRGWRMGRGMGWGRCFRFPWLPRWWWAYPEYQNRFEVPQPTQKEEKEMLNEELEILQEEIKVIKDRLNEFKGKK